MRIAQVSASDAGGGAEQVAMDLHRGYRARGHDALLVVGWRRTGEPGIVPLDNLSARGIAGGLERMCQRAAQGLAPAAARVVRAIGMVGQPRRLVGLLAGHEDFHMPATRRLLDLLPGAPDVIHCHNLHGGYFDLRELSRLSSSVPVLMTLHDMWALTGHCAYSVGCERWRDGCGKCPDLTLYPAILRDATRGNLARKRRIYSRSRLRVAAPSRWLLDKARAAVLAEGTVEWRVIPNGVDLAVFHPGDRAGSRARLGIPADARVLLYVANLGERNSFKDYATADEAARRVAATAPDERLVFLVVGGSSDARTEGRTRFLPRVGDRAVMADCYRSADVFLHAAREDNFPCTVLESLACGTPVVATAVGGVPEQIEDGLTGQLVPPGDPAAMADASVRLLESRERIARMGARAAAAARDAYGLERCVSEYLSWMQEIVEAERERSREAADA